MTEPRTPIAGRERRAAASALAAYFIAECAELTLLGQACEERSPSGRVNAAVAETQHAPDEVEALRRAA